MKKFLRVLSLILVVFSAFSSLSFFASAKDVPDIYSDIWEEVDLTHEDEIKPCFYPELFAGSTYIWYDYNMLYAYYDSEQTTPEYVVFIATTAGDEAFCDRYVGDCLIVNNCHSYLYDLAHYVYVPAQQKVYTLEEAYYSEDLDISDAMRSGRIGLHRGDINYDRSCDVLDATYIQRYLAGLNIDSDINIRRMDLDGSGDVSIIDATKLQRYIAKIDDSFTVATIVES